MSAGPRRSGCGKGAAGELVRSLQTAHSPDRDAVAANSKRPCPHGAGGVGRATTPDCAERSRARAAACAGHRSPVRLFPAFQQRESDWRASAEEKDALLLGGAMFNNSEAAAVWRTIPGLAAVVGAESDLDVSALVEAVCNGESLARFPGLTLPDGQKTAPAPPLRQLDDVRFPDYTDFPWDRYRVRIVPLMTGRGCQWDRCHFCSDVFTVNGRTFRTRSVENVLLEMQEQARRHATTSFLFHDLKLNSYPDMIRGIASKVQSYVNGAEWIGTVHVDLRKDNDLSRKDLLSAVSGGMRRINFGLESGSQALLDRMDKGTSVARNSNSYGCLRSGSEHPVLDVQRVPGRDGQGHGGDSDVPRKARSVLGQDSIQRFLPSRRHADISNNQWK